MYDLRGDLLVFVTQTHHPLLEHHTGYIFAEYRFTYHKPRELFFQHIYEVNLYALHTGAKIELNPDNKPGIVTALDYVLSAQDDSQYGEVLSGMDSQAATRWRKDQGRPKEVESATSEVSAWDAEEEKGTGLGAEFGDLAGEVGDIDFFGSEE